VSSVWFRVGLIAIVASFLPWLAIAVAPLFGLSLGAGMGLVGALLVLAEVLFWTGLALAGKDTWQSIKAYGWRRAPRELGRLLVSGRAAGPLVDQREPAGSTPPAGPAGRS
jgi:hypothetical protein